MSMTEAGLKLTKASDNGVTVTLTTAALLLSIAAKDTEETRISTLESLSGQPYTRDHLKRLKTLGWITIAHRTVSLTAKGAGIAKLLAADLQKIADSENP